MKIDGYNVKILSENKALRVRCI